MFKEKDKMTCFISPCKQDTKNLSELIELHPITFFDLGPRFVLHIFFLEMDLGNSIIFTTKKYYGFSVMNVVRLVLLFLWWCWPVTCLKCETSILWSWWRRLASLTFRQNFSSNCLIDLPDNFDHPTSRIDSGNIF